ncbi:MAG: formate dehydrogenase subunit alpha [Desulfuromonadia bacterium]
MRRTDTVCPWCGTGCGITLVHDGVRLLGTEPSTTHPVNRGTLCVKGWNAHGFVHHPDRLTTPLIRRGGELIPAPWDEAINLVVEGFQDIQRGHGNDSLIFLSSAKATNEENYLLMKLARAIFRTNNVDHCARLCHSSTVVALGQTLGSGAMTGSIGDLDHADLFLVIGSNTTEQHPMIGTRIMEQVVGAGVPLIVADNRQIPLSRHATLHLRHHNGTDTALLCTMMKVIIDEGLHDQEFIASRTDGFRDLEESLAEWSLSRGAEITGLPPSEIREAARLVATAPRVSIIFAMGITQHTHGVDNVRALSNLALLTGNIGRPGTGLYPLRGQSNVQGSCDMGALPEFLTGYQRVDDPAIRRKFALAWGVDDLPSTPGLSLTDAMEKVKRGEIRGMLVMGENPVLTDPDGSATRQALEKLDILVVIDIFPTETARLAHVVLPAACFAEKGGSVTSTERRVQLMRRAIPPPGDAKSDREIITLIARRAGYEGMEYGDEESVIEEIRRLTPLYGGIDHHRLPPFGIQWPCPDPGHPGTPMLHTERFSRGRGLFVPISWRPPAEAPDDEFPFILTTGRCGVHWHGGNMTRRIHLLEREEPSPFVEINPADAGARSIRDGDRVTVTSRRGSVTLPARVTPTVPPGVLFIPFHFAEAPVNVLIGHHLDPESRIPEFKVCAVAIGRKG